MDHRHEIPGIRIRRASLGDASSFPAIENSAGDLFRQIPELAYLADGEDLPADWYRDLVGHDASFVAATPEWPVAFLCAEAEGGVLHIWELGVSRRWQGRGIGRALMSAAIEAARRRGLAAATLTTFRDVPWNAPFYKRLGFEILPETALDDRLAAALRQDAERGLPLCLRCVMRLSLA